MVGLSKKATLVARNIFPTNFLNGGFDKNKCPVLTDPVLKKKKVHFIKSVQNTAFKLNFWFFKIKILFLSIRLKLRMKFGVRSMLDFHLTFNCCYTCTAHGAIHDYMHMCICMLDMITCRSQSFDKGCEFLYWLNH